MSDARPVEKCDDRPEGVQARRIRWDIGPFHAWLPGAYRLCLDLDGEVVRGVSVETGFTARGLETILTRHSWRGVVPYLDRLDPDGAAFAEWAYCLAVEELAAIDTPPRARAIRILLAELTRISCHLLYLAKVARAAGSEAAFHLLIRERERVLDLLELLCGARHAVAFIIPSGVREDVTEGFLERVQEVCQHIRVRLKEYNDLVTYNEAFVRRVVGRGVIGRMMVDTCGVSGIPERIFYPANDLRRREERLGYGAFRPDAQTGVEPLGVAGDTHHRFVFRLHEMVQSAHILQELSQRLPAGAYRLRSVNEHLVAQGVARAAVESARGRLEATISSDGRRTGPSEAKFSTPSESLLSILPQYLEGAPVQDLSLLLHALDMRITEVDR